MQKSISLTPALIVFFSIAAFLTVIYLALPNTNQVTNTNTTRNTNVVACTLEAKLCPDGSSVGRAGPNCEFAACPTIDTNGATNTNSITNTNSSADPTAGWETYTNTTYGYSMKYPDDFSLTPTPNGDESILFEKGRSGYAGYYFITIGIVKTAATNSEVQDDIYAWAQKGFLSSDPITLYHANPRSITLGKNTFILTDGDQASSAIPEYLIFHENILYRIGSYSGSASQVSNRELIATFAFMN